MSTVKTYSVDSGDATNLTLKTNGTTAVTVDSSQNVGIGTTSPASKLHVAGSFRQTGATAPFEWTVNAGANDYLKLNAVGYADNLIVANSAGNVGIGVTPTNKLDVNAGASNTVMGITSSNVNSSNLLITNSNSGAYVTIGAMGATGYGIGGWANSTVIESVPASTGGLTIGSYTGTIKFQTNARTTQMTLDSSGNVGIGTSSPTSSLVVSGAAQGIPTVNGVHLGTESGYAKIELVGTSVTGSLIDFTQTSTDYKGRILYDNTYNFFTFATNGSERMRIDSSGNLWFNSGYGSVATAYGCRAWVNFNGTGTVAIRASGNVSSITDNGVGQYTVNFSTAMPDANYAVVKQDGERGVGESGTLATGSCQVIVRANTTDSTVDSGYVFVAVFR
jgi:hypothetical protein